MRSVLLVIAIPAVLSWLFLDTVRHYYPSSQDTSTLRFSHFGTYQDYQVWRELIEAFEDHHPDIDINQEYVVGWYGLYDRKLRQQYLAKVEPHIALVQASSFLALADQFVQLPGNLDNGIELEDLDPVACNMYRVGQLQKGVPVTGGNLLIYYNKKCFRKASVFRNMEVPFPSHDWSMDEFAATARALTFDLDDDDHLDQFGFWQPRWVYYLPFLWSFGANVLNESGEHWVLSDDAAVKALEFYRAMRCGPGRYAPQPHETAQILQDVGFLTGRTAMCINGPWFIPFLNASNLANDYGVANIPRGNAGRFTRVTWDGIAASKRLSNQSRVDAIEFVSFVCSSEGQRILTRSARALPARNSERASLSNNHSEEMLQRFVKALEYSMPEPQTDRFRQVDLAINRKLETILKPDSTASIPDFLQSLLKDPAIAPFASPHSKHPTTKD